MRLTLWQDFRYPNIPLPPACKAWAHPYSRFHRTCRRSRPLRCTSEFCEHIDLVDKTDWDENVGFVIEIIISMPNCSVSGENCEAKRRLIAVSRKRLIKL